MPENNCCGYKCYLNKVNARNNCVINKPANKNITMSSTGVYVNSLYCSNSCGNNGNVNG